MTQIDEPNLDSKIEEFVAEYYHRWVKYGYYGSPDKPLNKDTEYRQACDFIKALIATQVQEAEKQGALNALTQLKVDYMNEWVGIDPKTMGLKTAPLNYKALIEERIAQLRSTK